MSLLQQLENEFGDKVTVHEAAPHAAVDGVLPQAVAAPRDAEAALALAAWCGREGVAFVVRGGGTKIGIGARPELCNLVISTEHLNRIIEHDEGNATVTVEAGIILESLNRAVGESGQFVPLDGTQEGSRATLGGVVATNHSGLTRLKYGTPRDLVVGLHAALSDGRMVKAGSKVVKNVSGYDLNKVFIGSFGTLGLITQVTLRLRPHDAAGTTWETGCKSWQAAAELARTILDGPFEPTGLRVHADGSTLRLIVRFDGGETSVRTQLERLPQGQASDESALDTLQHTVQLRAVLPLQSALKWARQAQGAGARQIAWDCGLGIIRAGFDDMPNVQALRAAAEQAAGFLLVEQAPPEVKTPELVWGAPRSDFALVQRLKKSYDPARVCAPGRFIGGI